MTGGASALTVTQTFRGKMQTSPTPVRRNVVASVLTPGDDKLHVTTCEFVLRAYGRSLSFCVHHSAQKDGGISWTGDGHVHKALRHSPSTKSSAYQPRATTSRFGSNSPNGSRTGWVLLPVSFSDSAGTQEVKKAVRAVLCEFYCVFLVDCMEVSKGGKRKTGHLF